MSLSIDIPSVTYRNNKDDQSVIFYFVDDAIVSNPNAPRISAAQSSGASRTRIIGAFIDLTILFLSTSTNLAKTFLG